MRKTVIAITTILLLVSCAPVLQRQMLHRGSRDVPLSDMMKAPDNYKGKLYVLGGTIIDIRAIDAGILLEAVYVPVDKRGHLRMTSGTKDRFLALYPKEMGQLDRKDYERGRNVTVAGLFTGTQPVKLKEEMYAYPLFKVEQIHLWPEKAILETGNLPAVYPWELPHHHPATTDPAWRYYSPLP